MALKSQVVILLLLLFLLLSSAMAFNITAILEPFSEFATFSNYLNQTKLVYEINHRKTITVLVVDNSKMSTISSLPEESLKHVMEVHVILDYYDIRKISHIPHRSFLLTTLFQTTSVATNKMGFLNLTHNADKLVVFGSAVRGAPHTFTLIKKIVTMPYNISVLQISEPIIPLGIDGAPSVAIVTAPLEKADPSMEAPEVDNTPIESLEDDIVDAPAAAPEKSTDTPADSPEADESVSDAFEEPSISRKKVIDASTSTSSRSRLSIGAILGFVMSIVFLRAL